MSTHQKCKLFAAVSDVAVQEWANRTPRPAATPDVVVFAIDDEGQLVCRNPFHIAQRRHPDALTRPGKQPTGLLRAA